MTRRAPHPGRIRPHLKGGTGEPRRGRLPIGRVRATPPAPEASWTRPAEHLREQRFRALLEGVPVARLSLGGGHGRPLPLRQPPDRGDARLQPGAVDGRPRALARAHPSGRSRPRHERGGRRASRAACSTTSTASCMPTGTSCGCATRRAGSWTRTAKRASRASSPTSPSASGPRPSSTHTAQHDPLTGSSTGVSSRASWSTSSARRDDAPYAVLFVDIDRFKLVNDGHGHEAGDALLREAGSPAPGGPARGRRALALRRRRVHRLPARLRRRLRGRRRAARARHAGRPFPVARGEVYVGGSVGIALTGGDSTNASDLIRDADVAMYAAKQGGRGRHAALRHEPARGLGPSSRDRQRPAPRARARTRSRCSCSRSSTSATAAWPAWRRCCAGGARDQVVPPLEFVPLAEEAGLIGEIERFALAEACRMGQRARSAASASPSP